MYQKRVGFLLVDPKVCSSIFWVWDDDIIETEETSFYNSNVDELIDILQNTKAQQLKTLRQLTQIQKFLQEENDHKSFIGINFCISIQKFGEHMQ